MIRPLGVPVEIEAVGCVHSRFACDKARMCRENVGHSWEVADHGGYYMCTNCCAFGHDVPNDPMDFPRPRGAF